MAAIFQPFDFSKGGDMYYQRPCCLQYFQNSENEKKNAEEQIDRLVQERCNSSANALELRLPCIDPSKCWFSSFHPWSIVKICW